MLRITGPARGDWTRRDLIQAGGLTALGLTLPAVLGRAASPAAAGFGRARSCVLVYLFGGPSHIDLWDLKPDAPAEVRGEFRPVRTNVPGLAVCEHLPRLAGMADRYCLIRGMTHEHPRHGWGLYYTLTGHRHNRPDLDAPPTPDDFPGLGALVAKLGRRPRGLPPAVTLPRWNRFLDVPNDYAGEKGGFLGGGFDPWLVRAGPDGQSFAPDGLELPLDVPPGRLDGRRRLLEAVDRRVAEWGERGPEHDALSARAHGLLTSAAVRRAFDLAHEPGRLRDRYGRHAFGQGLLLARRLVEAGAVLVQVNWHNDGSDVKSPFWDTHKDNFNRLKNDLLPPLDVGLSALLTDLGERGLLETTLVLVTGEFGRTPRVGQVVMNAATDRAGRDHWPHAYAALAAGGGVKGGRAFGATDRRAAYVVESPVTPPDMQATVLHALGVSPGAVVHDRRGRPHRASDGQPVARLF